jgi:hypothetical protein
MSYVPQNIIKITDNQGKSLIYSGISLYYKSSSWPVNNNIHYILESGKSAALLDQGGLFAAFDYNNPAVTSFTVTVSDISSINGARWKFAINR